MRHKGFTLIELMIVVAVVAVLAMIALPSYSDSVRKSRRAQGKADLTEVSQLLERKYTVDRQYTGYDLPFTTSPRDPGATVGYNLTVEGLTDKAYKLVATPTTVQASDTCGILSLDQLGVKHHQRGPDEVCVWGTVE